MKNSKKISNFKFQIPKVIILMGPPGSGKGTQAELLAERLNLFHLETSKILEEKFKEKTKGKISNRRQKIQFFKREKTLGGGQTLLPSVRYLFDN